MLSWLSIPPHALPSPVAVERSGEARQRLTAERNRHRGRLPWSCHRWFMRWAAH